MHLRPTAAERGVTPNRPGGADGPGQVPGSETDREAGQHAVAISETAVPEALGSHGHRRVHDGEAGGARRGRR